MGRRGRDKPQVVHFSFGGKWARMWLPKKDHRVCAWLCV